MRLISIITSFAVITGFACSYCAAGLTYDSQQLKIYDTLTSYNTYLTPSQITNKFGWKQITDGNISGDLCIENDRMVVILRRNSPGPDAYYKLGYSLIKALSLYPIGAGNDHTVNIESLKVISGNETHILVDTLFRTKSGSSISMEYLLRPAQATIEMLPGQNAQKILMQTKSSYAVMPDLFADDLVIDPKRAKSEKLFLPTDNHLLLQMIDNGDAIIVCNWPSSNGEVVVRLSNNNYKKLIAETTISLENNNKIWVSILAGEGIWHSAHTPQFNIYKHSLLNWTVPFPAYWRLNYQRTDGKAFGLTDSFWNAQMQDDGALKLVPNLLDMDIIDGRYIIAGHSERKRLVRHSVVNPYTGSGWWTYRGWFIQPFYTHRDSAFIKIPKFDGRRTIRYAGLILIYPLLKVDTNYNNDETVEDVLYHTFGPEYLSIMDLADLNRRSDKDRFPPTCPTTDYCEKIFEQEEELYRKKHIAAILGQMNLFVKHTRQRLQEYSDWEKQMKLLYQENAQANPDLARFINTVQNITSQIPQRFSASLRKIKSPEHTADLSAKVVELIDHNTPHKLRRCKQICRQIRFTGDTQDELLGEYRDIVKTTRQKAALLHTEEIDPDVRRFLRLVRGQTQRILRVRYDMEGK